MNRTTRIRVCSATLLATLFLRSLPVQAQTTQFTYQGKLSDGSSLASGNYDFQFKLFDMISPGTGTQQGTTLTVSNLAVTAGIFTVQLNFGACAACFNGDNRFLEVGVKPVSDSTYTILSPRQQVASTPYALRSLSTAVADGLSVACVNCVTSSQIASVNASAVTGTLPPASIPAGSTNYIQNATAQQASSNFNVSGNGTIGGSLGIGTAITENQLQVFNSSGASKATIGGNSSGGGYTSLVLGTSAATDGYSEIQSVQTSGSAYGVLALNPAGGNVGIGHTGPGSVKLLVDGGSNSTAAIAATITGSSSVGVFASNNAGFAALYGSTTSGIGVYGSNLGSNTEGYAGHFNGRVLISGNLTKGGGSFKIDHPLDPANKYLYHSFVESPDMMNIYNGNVVLDDDGTAWVELPEWFEALNRDFRYQLTSIGAFSPVFVAEEIRQNRFKIAGGARGQKVSWQVTGVRHDAYAEAYRIPVEEEKNGNERGRYQYPELYGYAKEDAIGYAAKPHVNTGDSVRAGVQPNYH